MDSTYWWPCPFGPQLSVHPSYSYIFCPHRKTSSSVCATSKCFAEAITTLYYSCFTWSQGNCVFSTAPLGHGGNYRPFLFLDSTQELGWGWCQRVTLLSRTPFTFLFDSLVYWPKGRTPHHYVEWKVDLLEPVFCVALLPAKYLLKIPDFWLAVWATSSWSDALSSDEKISSPVVHSWGM